MAKEKKEYNVMLFATSKEQKRKMLCEFKKVTEKVGLRIHPDKTKILSNQCTLNSDTKKKQLEVDDMKIEKLTRNESVKYLGQKISFYQQEMTEIKIRIRACMGDIPQIQTRVDIEKLHAQTPSYGYSTPQYLRLFAMQREHGHPTKNTKE